MLPSLSQCYINYLGSIKDATPDPRDITITSPYRCNYIPDGCKMAINKQDQDEEERKAVLVYFMHCKQIY
jgi:hypothetical protein